MDFSKKVILGMVHLGNTTQDALDEIKLYSDYGLSGAIIENYHGDIYDVIDVLEKIDYKSLNNFEIGVNILPNNYGEAYDLALKYPIKFIQLDHIAGNYLRTNSIDYSDFLKYRDVQKNITILGGVHPKYYTPVTNSILSEDINEGMRYSDAIVVTGTGTGKVTPIEKILEFKETTKDFPLIIGAGLNVNNVYEQLSLANGCIVGSCFKEHGITTNKVSSKLVNEFMIEANKLSI